MRIISNKYMNPGFGDGGSCHPRDNIALRSLAKDLNSIYLINNEGKEIQAKNMAKNV